jgi:uncharacterized protein (TIGR02246 family)
MKRIQVLLLLCFPALGCHPARDSERAPSASAAVLEELFAAHDQAWNRHDAQAMAALFSPDGTLVTPSGTRVEGHDALVSLFSQDGPTKSTSSVTRIDAVQWLSEDLVIVDATQHVSGPGTEDASGVDAQLVAVVRQVDDAWQIAAARPYVPRDMPASRGAR